MSHHNALLPAALISAALLASSPIAAQDDDKVLGWSKTAEVSLVTTSGNSETDTTGLNAAFVKTMANSTLTLDANGLRAESTTTARTAVGTSPSDFLINESSTGVLNAEHYSVGGRFDRDVNAALFWFAGLRWAKNEFAGFSERITALAGAGNTWWKTDASRLRTDYGITYTQQDDLVPTPGVDDAFLGARVSYDYRRTITSSSNFGSLLAIDQNFAESADRRADFTNWIAVSISDRLALKVSLQALYDNLPASGRLPLLLPDGTPTGESVLFTFDDTDTILTTALVVTF